jgi:hypothetical protein
MILLLLLVMLGLILVALAAFNVVFKPVGLLAAGLFCWMLAWAIITVFVPLVGLSWPR